MCVCACVCVCECVLGGVVHVYTYGSEKAAAAVASSHNAESGTERTCLEPHVWEESDTTRRSQTLQI